MSQPGNRPNPMNTAGMIEKRPYFEGTITRTSTKEVRRVDTRFTSRQIRWCMQNYGCSPFDLISTGASIETARLTVSPATFVVFWALAGIPTGADNADFEQLLDLRADQVLDEFKPELDIVMPEDGDSPDPTATPGSDG